MTPLSRPDRAPHRAALLRLVGAVLALFTIASPAFAQRRARFPDELRGSKESVQKMYDFAQSHGLPFYLTPTNLQEAIAKGKLVQLTGDSTYELTRSVGFSYSTPEAKQFVIAFAPRYLAACGTPLIVTSAARPISRQPRNSNPYSVHPTGIAVDLRRPPAGPCQTWLRNALAELEVKGFVEATEERHPAHLHVAVLTEPGRVATLPPLSASSVVARAKPPAPVHLSNVPAATAQVATKRVTSSNGRTYRVRDGDTLWDVAQRTGVSVQALARANNRSARAVLRPGVTLRIPESPSR
ncbi:MAG TPA: DUF5715 family protein [Gemmatimonadaceae bacterium]|jgi:LysM repeat protein|nr:DUF5715 family protein [Gemmatimonadaceae bacterium]